MCPIRILLKLVGRLMVLNICVTFSIRVLEYGDSIYVFDSVELHLGRRVYFWMR